MGEVLDVLLTGMSQWMTYSVFTFEVHFAVGAREVGMQISAMLIVQGNAAAKGGSKASQSGELGRLGRTILGGRPCQIHGKSCLISFASSIPT